MPEIYVSTDIEADGPIPGDFSMLSLGAAAFLPDGTLHSAFTANLEPLPGAGQNPDNVAFFEKDHPEAWAACQGHRRPPQEALTDFVQWLNELPGKPVFVAYPASYDFLFVYWYLRHFGLESPFRFHALDMRTFAMGLLGTEFWQANIPERWKRRMAPDLLAEALRNARGHPHPELLPAVDHVALVDALHQGCWFFAMLQERQHRA